MNVALVHDFLLKLGGAERVLQVLTELYPEAPIYTLLYDQAKVGRIFPPAKVMTSDLQKLPKFLRTRYRYFFPRMPTAMEKFDFSGFDLVISSSSAYAHGVVTPTGTRHICYCHSPMRYVWDWTHQYLDKKKLGFIRFWFAQQGLHKIRIWDKAAADRVDHYIANSEHVRRRIIKYYRLPSQVIYPPVDVNRFEISHGHEDYFLIVSTLSPYKRIDLAVQLFNKIKKRLIIIGEGSERFRLENMAGKNIEFLGFKDDAVVAEYFKHCRAMIFPGEEDFGIAPIEAMACGKPVLGFGQGGLLETVIPGVSGEFFYEPNVGAMEDGLGRLLLNEGSYKPTVIRQQAEKFSKERFCREFKETVDKLSI